jgi:hypothetical protein
MKSVSINGYPVVQMKMKVRIGSFQFARSPHGKWPNTSEFSWLMGILEGHEVDASVFSGTNVVGKTSEDQLRQAFSKLNPEYQTWIKEPQLEALIAKFGDGKLGFDMSGMYCESTPKEIDALLIVNGDGVSKPCPCGDTTPYEQWLPGWDGYKRCPSCETS